MKKIGKKILIVLGVLVLLFVIFVGYVIYDSEKQEKVLNNEINRILGLDILSDTIDMNIVTRDEYAVIEKTIKTYYRDYSNCYKAFMNELNNFDFESMFSASTFASDGPSFVKSKRSLSSLQKSTSDNLDKLVKMSSSEYITGLIEKKDLDSYYVDLYKEYMFGNDVNSFEDELSKDVVEIEKLSEDINLFLDDCYKIYDFLSENRNYWEVDVDNNTILFADDSKISAYNELLNKIIEDVSKISDIDDIGDNDSNNGSNTIGSV